MIITSASVELNRPQLLNIFSKIESILLDILFYLEKQFGNLDELDIDTDSKNEEELEEIVKHIQVIIYNDHSVSIGDDNRIKDSTISSEINT